MARRPNIGEFTSAGSRLASGARRAFGTAASWIREKARIAVPVAGLAVMLWVAGGPVTLAVPRSCSACHGSEYQHLRESSHADVRCQDCHSERAHVWGLANSVALSADVWDAVFQRSDRVAVVKDGACIACHDLASLEQPTESGALRMSHTGLSDADYRCVECHADVAHTTSPLRVSGVRMSICAQCHNNVRQSGACELCHITPETREAARLTDPEWSKTHGTNWRQLHGMGELSTCTLCHDQEKCAGCHGMLLPHDDAFAAVHGESAVQDKGVCLSCHTGAFCVSCHGNVEMPHPEGFLAQHSSIAAGYEDPVCLKCHTAGNCFDCHVRHVHPGGAGEPNPPTITLPDTGD